MEKQKIINEIGRKIRELRKKHNLTAIELSKLVGLSHATLLRIETGKVEAGITDILKICKYFNLDVNYFLTDTKLYTTQQNLVFVPLVEGQISAGKGLMAQNHIVDFIPFSKEWLQRKGDVSKMVLIRVSGDSMYPTLQNNDLVLIDTSKRHIDSQGGIYAIAIEDEILIKRACYVFEETKPGILTKKVKIISDNPVYEPLKFNLKDVVVNGKAIWYGREL